MFCGLICCLEPIWSFHISQIGFYPSVTYVLPFLESGAVVGCYHVSCFYAVTKSAKDWTVMSLTNDSPFLCVVLKTAKLEFLELGCMIILLKLKFSRPQV